MDLDMIFDLSNADSSHELHQESLTENPELDGLRMANLRRNISARLTLGMTYRVRIGWARQRPDRHRIRGSQ